MRGVADQPERALPETLQQRGRRHDAGLDAAMPCEGMPDRWERVGGGDGRGDLDRETREARRTRHGTERDAGDVGAQLDHSPIERIGVAGMFGEFAEPVVVGEVVRVLDLLDHLYEIVDADALLVECDDDAREDRIHFGPVHSFDRVQGALERLDEMLGSRAVNSARLDVRASGRLPDSPRRSSVPEGESEVSMQHRSSLTEGVPLPVGPKVRSVEVGPSGPVRRVIRVRH